MTITIRPPHTEERFHPQSERGYKRRGGIFGAYAISLW